MSYVVFVEIIMPTVYRDSFSRRGQIVVESISAYHGPNCYTIILARSTINARRCRVVSASDCGVRGSRVRITPRAVVFITTAAAQRVYRDLRRQKRRRIVHRLHTTQLLHRIARCITLLCSPRSMLSLLSANYMTSSVGQIRYRRAC